MLNDLVRVNPHDQVVLKGNISVVPYIEDGQVVAVELSDGIATYLVRAEFGGVLRVFQPRHQVQPSEPASVRLDS